MTYYYKSSGVVPAIRGRSIGTDSIFKQARFVTRLTRRVPLVEQEMLTLPEHLSSPPVFSGVSVTRSLVLYVCFVDSCLSFCTFSFDHCIVCSSSIYEFWLLLWYLQTFLALITCFSIGWFSWSFVFVNFCCSFVLYYHRGNLRTITDNFLF